MPGIPGSKRTLPAGELSNFDAKRVEEQPDVSGDTIQVTVVLRPGADPDAVRQAGPTRAALREAHRPNLSDLEKVINFAGQHGLTVIDLDRAPRMVVLAGTVGNITAAFQTEVEVWQQLWPWPSEQISQQSNGRSPFRFRLRPDADLQVPEELDGIVQGVFGIDNRKETRMQMHAVPVPVGDPKDPNRPKSYTVKEVADIYDFPTATDQGRGQVIAILSLGGRLDREGLAQYCGNLNIEIPQVFEVPVDGAPPQLGDQLDEDAEVALDVHVIAALVPNASIVSYMVCNTSRGFIDGLARAIYNESLPASTIAISYGAPEKTWTGQAISAIDDLLKDAAALNITVCCASGDLGSSDGVPGDKFNVDFPASSPHVLSCGGTTLTPNPENQAQPTEKVWSEPETIVGSGGGTSRIFATPDWQQNRDDPALKNLNGRGVPDVAGFADSRNGYTILVSEQMVRLGGTSAAAPLWAGLIARINENMGKPVGYLNPLLYRKITDQAFLDIEEGSNGEFHAQLGWDACTGLGRPRGGELLKQLKRLLS